jgi:uncharacterized protein YbjQ (UPF0145 family)
MSNCVGCGKKIGLMESSIKILAEENTFLCLTCYDKIKNYSLAVKKAETLNDFNVKAKKLLSIVDDIEFKQTGKEFIKRYISFYKKSLSKSVTLNIIADENEFLMTTGYNFEGYNIMEYKGVHTGSFVLGTGFISEFSASVSDLLGQKSFAFSEKIEEAKNGAIDILLRRAKAEEANAIIGISFDFITLSNNMIGVMASGTLVVVQKAEISNS